MPKRSKTMRVKIRKGLYLVKRGEIWYRESASWGKQERRSLETGDLQEAMRRIAEGRETPARASKPTPPAPSLSLATAYEKYEEWYRKNKRASSALRLFPVIERFIKFVGDGTSTEAVTRDAVQKFIDARRDGGEWTKDGEKCAPITVRNDFARVRAFLRWIDRRYPGRMKPEAVRGIDLPKHDGTTKAAPSVETVKAVLRELRKAKHPEWIGDFWAVLCETGMRPSELLGVRGSDLRGKLLSIEPWGEHDLKTKWSKRKIEPSTVAAAILEDRASKTFDRSRPIFANADGGRYKLSSVYHFFKDALEETEHVSITLYDARHFFCSEHGAPGPQHMELEALAAYIGHSPKSHETLIRWYTDQDALRRGAPVSLIGQPKEGRVIEMGR